jgi:hypothetical protein
MADKNNQGITGYTSNNYASYQVNGNSLCDEPINESISDLLGLSKKGVKNKYGMTSSYSRTDSRAGSRADYKRERIGCLDPEERIFDGL